MVFGPVRLPIEQVHHNKQHTIEGVVNSSASSSEPSRSAGRWRTKHHHTKKRKRIGRFEGAETAGAPCRQTGSIFFLTFTHPPILSSIDPPRRSTAAHARMHTHPSEPTHSSVGSSVHTCLYCTPGPLVHLLPTARNLTVRGRIWHLISDETTFRRPRTNADSINITVFAEERETMPY